MHAYTVPRDNVKKSTHLLRDCREFLELQKFYEMLNLGTNAQTTQGATAPSPPSESQLQHDHQCTPTEVYPPCRGKINMIHKTGVSKRELKDFTREINLAEVTMANTPKYIDWTEQNIMFSRADHPMIVPRPGHAAVVLEAQIGGFNMSKVFMDGGSNLNLMSASMMKAMDITTDMLQESDGARRKQFGNPKRNV
jgi:hypothetical protein